MFNAVLPSKPTYKLLNIHTPVLYLGDCREYFCKTSDRARRASINATKHFHLCLRVCLPVPLMYHFTNDLGPPDKGVW
jgi:hypothetical protein